MVYYFSGTGNSRFVAENLSRLLSEDCRKITETIPQEENPEGESIGFVFPVYSWGVAPEMIGFVNNLPPSFPEEVRQRNMAVWCVMTCGDEVALAPEMFAKVLSRLGLTLESVWSVIMPNNYVLLPGFDVDSKDIERKKLEDAPRKIGEIADGVRQRKKIVDVERGRFAWLKTKLVYPLFCKWGIFPRKWQATPTCVGCGLCAGVCPLHNIQMKDRTPQWGADCCSCLACYHSCPRHAVAYGRITFKKGQYFFPDIKVKK